MTTPDPSREAFYAWLRTHEDEVGALDDPSALAGWQAAMAYKEAEGGGPITPTKEPQTRMDACSDHGPNQGWQPIETAPRDGRYLLLWEQYSDNPFVGCWFKDRWSVCHEHVDAEGGWNGAIVVDRLQCPITHWAPLPAAPKQEGST